MDDDSVKMHQLHPLDIALKAAINGDLQTSEDILRSQPKDDLRVLFNLGWHEMRHRNMKKAYEHLNFGRFINVFGLPPIKGKIWKDEPLGGKIVLFRSEGGYGDQISNFRFAKKFKDMGATVVVSCSSELKELFSRHGFVTVDSEGIDHVYYDYWIPGMSAPFLLNMEYNDLDGSPYIYPTHKRKLFSKQGNIKVGIRWAGNPEFEHEQHRKFPEELMIGLSDIPNTTFFSLQRDENLITGLPFGDLAEQMKTWDDTASIIAGCDLIITSCTSIAHLAGAIGVPTWVVIPVMPYYTWAVPGSKSNWYNSVTLYRQEKYGDWSAPFNKIRQDLVTLSNKGVL